MPSVTTLFRAIVMVAIGIVVVKAWQLFGPSADQFKSAVVNATDMAQAAWKNFQAAGSDRHAPAPSGAAPPFAKTAPPTTMPEIQASAAPAAMPAAAPALIPSPANTGPAGNTYPPSVASSELFSAPVVETTPPSPPKTDARISALFSRLEQLGAAEPRLAPWGSSGHLYRFCCQAAWKDSPAFTQHFESVADEPSQAVEQVVAKVEAWRTAQRAGDTLR